MTAPLGEALRGLAASVVAAIGTRLELVSTDLEEQGAWLARIAAVAAAAFAFGIMACVSLAAFVVLAFGEHRVAAAGVVSLLFVFATLVLLARLAGALRDRPPLLAATRAVLDEDRARLDAAHVAGDRGAGDRGAGDRGTTP